MVTPDEITVVCAWCKKIIHVGTGDPAALVSHGICEACDEKLDAELQAWKPGREKGS